MITRHLPDARFSLPPSIEALEQLIGRLKTNFEHLMPGWLLTFHGIEQNFFPDVHKIAVSFAVFPVQQEGEKLLAVKCRFYGNGLQAGYDKERFKLVEVDRAIRNLLQALQKAQEAAR